MAAWLMRWIIGVVVVALAALATDGARAQTPRPDQAIKPGEKLLSRDELRRCFAQRDGLSARVVAYDREQKELDAQRAAIALAGAALAAEREKLDTFVADDVAALQARTDAHDQRIDAYNAQLPLFNQRSEALQAARAAYKRDCADRPYRESDERALVREAQRGKK